MKHPVKLYLATLLAFFAVDMLWLGFIAPSFYQKHIGHILAPEVNWIAAAVFYLLFIFGLIFFAVAPGRAETTNAPTLLRSALYGLITYATYDLTNHATVKDWPLLVTVVDLLWGTMLCSIVGLISRAIFRRLERTG